MPLATAVHDVPPEFTQPMAEPTAVLGSQVVLFRGLVDRPRPPLVRDRWSDGAVTVVRAAAVRGGRRVPRPGAAPRAPQVIVTARSPALAAQQRAVLMARLALVRRVCGGWNTSTGEGDAGRTPRERRVSDRSRGYGIPSGGVQGAVYRWSRPERLFHLAPNLKHPRLQVLRSKTGHGCLHGQGL